MNLFSGIQAQTLSWLHNTPLPVNETEATPIFQAWHEFDSSTQQWSQLTATRTTSDSPSDIKQRTGRDSELVLATWNIDAFSELPESRAEAIISHIISPTLAVDIIFLQEVSRAALTHLLDDPRIRESWFSSEVNATAWEGQSFATMTFLSKSRFEQSALGPVWRVKYPSRFGRDALCCDIFAPSSRAARTRIRLVNVHLDSLPIQPSHRPRQISILSSILHSAGSGLVAGDFNPVLPEDETLIQDNHLVDAWVELHQQEPGFTWGVDGKQPFPPGRLDKVAMIGLKVQDIQVMHPGVTRKERSQAVENSESQQQKHESEKLVPWSDHSGLKCSFKLLED